MTFLHSELRKKLEKAVVAAREAAEKGVRNALNRLELREDKPSAHLPDTSRSLRNALRAEARRLGQNGDGFKRLEGEAAYTHWHRMLFARFLAENDLLMHPTEGVSVSLEDCVELAEAEGDPDAWATAARYAAGMLPGIFVASDPTLKLTLAPEDVQALEKLLEGIPQTVFTSDDGLGWVYQFWQVQAKKEVNASGRKIGGADISPVTQLFTEHYMVEFLLHNTVGAWWAAKHPHSPINSDLQYLRRLEDGTPAAGTFPGWPDTVAELTVLDPCCGSGHFLTATAALLAWMRAEEEGIGQSEALERVLAQNLYGLELDPRCTQLAAFGLALLAWKTGGYRPLSLPNVACSGIPVGRSLDEWTRLAGEDHALRYTLERLYELFSHAPDLGSLIDPSSVTLDLYAAPWEQVEALLDEALSREKTADPASALFGEAAKGVARAAALLRRKYHLVITNVPYLGRGNQGDVVKSHLERHFAAGKADLATAFVLRSRDFCTTGGSYALVTPQNWLFLGSYKKLREELLKGQSWNQIARLGAKGFQTPMWDFNVMLATLTNSRPETTHQMSGLDVSTQKTPLEKAEMLEGGAVVTLEQAGQLKNPDARVAFKDDGGVQLLSTYAESFWGQGTGDFQRFGRNFWEVKHINEQWDLMQSTVDSTMNFGGRDLIVFWEQGKGQLVHLAEELKHKLKNIHYRGSEAWRRVGVSVSQMGTLPVTIYTGQIFDGNCASIVPKEPKHALAIWAFCSSPDFATEVRKIDQKISVTNATLVKVPFDLEHWTQVALERYSNGLPEPYSNDPTQWLFKGTVTDTTQPLQVAVARLLGYRWPDQTPDGLLEVEEGILPLPALLGQLSGPERLRSLLAVAFGVDWTPHKQSELLASVGADSLEDWLRDKFFAEHAKLFHNRPFIWHIWDGRKDGFGALVNYHTLDKARLEKLTYTHLGAWIQRQEDEVKRETAGADLRLLAARELQTKLEAILSGEPRFDVYVRWKPLEAQAIGWNPDLNDGVRLNLRPFVTAGVLRSKFTVNWNKDRGNDPKPNPSGTTERHNDLHFSRAEKEAARAAALRAIGEKAGV